MVNPLTSRARRHASTARADAPMRHGCPTKHFTGLDSYTHERKGEKPRPRLVLKIPTMWCWDPHGSYITEGLTEGRGYGIATLRLRRRGGGGAPPHATALRTVSRARPSPCGLPKAAAKRITRCARNVISHRKLCVRARPFPPAAVTPPLSFLSRPRRPHRHPHPS